MVLPREVGGATARQVAERVVVAAEGPDGVAGGVDAHDGEGVAARDDVISRGDVLVDAVDVEEIQGLAGGPGGALVEVEHRVLEGHVLRGPPLEEELPRLDVHLLEDAVDDPPLLGAAGGREVHRHGLVDGEEGGVVARYGELVEVSPQVLANGFDGLEGLVFLVQLYIGTSNESVLFFLSCNEGFS